MNVQSATERAGRLHRIARFALLAAAGSLAACASVGPDKVVSTHIAYNEAVQLTTTREVLVNVVRGRYSDPMSFVRVETINAQFSVTAGATAGAGGLGQEGAAAELGTSFGYSDSPTITYVPQSDAAFYKSMHSPMEVEDVIGLLHLGAAHTSEPGLAGPDSAIPVRLDQRRRRERYGTPQPVV